MSNALLNLTHETIFPDLNKVEGKDEQFARSQLNIFPLKYKHIKSMVNLKEEEQMHSIMKTLTGLSDKDLDELHVEDIAELTGIIYEFMKKYVELSKKVRADNA